MVDTLSSSATREDDKFDKQVATPAESTLNLVNLLGPQAAESKNQPGSSQDLLKAATPGNAAIQPGESGRRFFSGLELAFKTPEIDARLAQEGKKPTVKIDSRGRLTDVDFRQAGLSAHLLYEGNSTKAHTCNIASTDDKGNTTSESLRGMISANPATGECCITDARKPGCQELITPDGRLLRKLTTHQADGKGKVDEVIDKKEKRLEITGDGYRVQLQDDSKGKFHDWTKMTETTSDGKTVVWQRGLMEKEKGELWRDRWTSQDKPGVVLSQLSAAGGKVSYMRYENSKEGQLHYVGTETIKQPGGMRERVLQRDSTEDPVRLLEDGSGRVAKVFMPFGGAVREYTYDAKDPKGSLSTAVERKDGQTRVLFPAKAGDKDAEVGRDGTLTYLRRDGMKVTEESAGGKKVHDELGRLREHTLVDGTTRTIDYDAKGLFKVVDKERTANGGFHTSSMVRQGDSDKFQHINANKKPEDRVISKIDPDTGVIHFKVAGSDKAKDQYLISQMNKLAPDFRIAGQRDRQRADLRLAAEGAGITPLAARQLKEDMKAFEDRMSNGAKSKEEQAKQQAQVSRVYDRLTEILTGNAFRTVVPNDRLQLTTSLLHRVAHPESAFAGNQPGAENLGKAACWTAKYHPDKYASKICDSFLSNGFIGTGSRTSVDLHPEALTPGPGKPNNLADRLTQAIFMTSVRPEYRGPAQKSLSPAEIEAAKPLTSVDIDTAVLKITGTKYRR